MKQSDQTGDRTNCPVFLTKIRNLSDRWPHCNHHYLFVRQTTKPKPTTILNHSRQRESQSSYPLHNDQQQQQQQANSAMRAQFKPRQVGPKLRHVKAKRQAAAQFNLSSLLLLISLASSCSLLLYSLVNCGSQIVASAEAAAASASSSPLAAGALNGPDRVHVIRQPSSINPTSYKQTKQTFKENFEKLVIHVKENTPIGTKLTDVQPRDADNGSIIGGSGGGASPHLHGGQSSPNDKAIYAIVGGADQQSFTLRIDERDNKVELINEVNFDYESAKKNYHVIIRATSLYLRYELEVDILVEDENDNKPQLEDFAIVFNNYKNNFPTGPIGRVPATDLDINDALRYRVLIGNNAQLIIVNETNGDIQLSPWLNSNVPLRAVMDVAVSDGINEAVAKLVLTVNLVTESMLHNSVVLRLDGVGRDEFLTRKYDIFLNQMARILGTSSLYSTNDIVVFDVEEGHYNASSAQQVDQLALSASVASASPLNELASSASSLHFRTYQTSITNASSLYLNVSFSARADGNDVEAYLSRQYIEGRIFLNRMMLSANLDAQVAPFQDDICVTEPCQNYQECQVTYKFDKAPKAFYTNRNIIFRFIKTSQSFNCLCPPTFTGMKNKNECNLQINQCFSNPCLNGGICHRHELGYTCECRPDYFGPKCEHSFTTSTCQSIGKPPSTPFSSSMLSTSEPSSSSSSSLTTTANSRVLVGGLVSSYATTTQQQQQQAATAAALVAIDDPFRQFSNPVCSGKSRCVNLNKSHQHYYQKSSSASISSPASSGSAGGFTCQGCPYSSQWSTDLCQLRARSFEKNSYIVLPSLRRRHRFHIMLQFATVQSDALLLYNGRYNDKRDFIALEIVDSRLKFSYSLGSINTTNSVTLASMPISDGQWHKVAIDYRDRNVTLIADDCDPVLDEALAQMQPLTARRCSNTTYGSAQIANDALMQHSELMLDLTSPMQIGALPLTSMGAGEYSQSGEQHLSTLLTANSFSGCMGDIYIDHQLVDLSLPLQDSGTQAGCPEKRSFCQQQSCNGYPCQNLYGSARCQCGDERLGKSCESYISQEKVRKFSGNSYLTFNPIESQVPANWQVSLHFRTINPNGVLFKISLDPEATILLELANGGLKLTYRSRSLSLNKIQLDDGEWHFVELVWSSESTMLQLDYNVNLSAQSNELGQVAGATMRSVVVGASSTRYSSSSSSSSSSSTSLAPAVSGAGQQDPLLAPETSADLSGITSTTSSGQPQLQTNGAGGTSGDDYANLYMYAMNSTTQSFVGCIYGLNISDNSEWWQSPNDERNVERGCPVVDVCETSQCPANSRCVRKGMNQRKCICNPGHVGDQCIPVCDLNPCQGANSRCYVDTKNANNATTAAVDLAASTSLTLAADDQQQLQQLATAFGANNNLNQQQYVCECEPHRSGKNCEHQLSARCPSNWWGKPMTPGQNSSICGPCNCDESSGFDGDCDKTTGQCFCKPNHYQPPGSDYCLACDCYLVGSLSTSCNQTSGQCKCRPGVVGRRCDTCASPYAEVTLRGCEVIYDACPKTYSDGIWWDKTQLGRAASQPCPASTSTGTATRFCHQTEGWQRAKLFDCISNTFTDLYTQYQFLEENKFQMTTNLAMKIATNLRNALNETISSPSMQLYGSDMYISFRLLHHLIQHESRQTGLNLTHRQDRLYIRNIAESISYILDPAYADSWPEIAARYPHVGAEYLLKLMDSYGKVLIDSQSDTFTQPFEVSTKYFQFGMDILSIDQLFDSNKWSLNPSSSSGSLSSSPSGGAGGVYGSPPSHFPSSPPYATDPFDPIGSPAGGGLGGLSSPLFGGGANSPRHVGSTEPQSSGHFNSDGTSMYLDFTSTRDASPSVIVPKYDNYPVAADSAGQEQATKALIPLKTLRMRTPKEVLGSYYPARSRAKREDLIMPEYVSGRNQKQPIVVYSIYKTLGPLLPNNYDNTVQNRLGVLAQANSPVVWLTIRPQNSSEFLNKNIQPKITYMLKMVEPLGKTRPQCAIWDFISPASSSSPLSTTINGLTVNNLTTTAAAAAAGGASYGIKQTGRFTTRGCEIKGVHPNHRLRYKYDYVNCSCDHLGAVIVLMDSATTNYDYMASDEVTNIKDLSLQLALGVSLAILLTILFVLSCIRGHSIKSNSNSINKNLIVILMIIELLILYSLMSRGSLNQREYQCKLVAIFLHYFSISLFFWLLVNAIHFYRMLTELRDINHGPMKFYHVIGYAVPAFFVSIAVGLRIEQFGNYLFCWLSIHEPIIWSMFGPISLVSMLTIILFKFALCKSLPLDKNHDDPNGVDLIKTHMLINIIKTPVIGIYWLIAVYSVNEALVDFVYLFPVTIVAKSVILFLVLCIVDRYIRYNLYVSWLRFRGEKVPFLDDPLGGAAGGQYGGGVINPLNNSQPWMASMMNSMPGAEFGIVGSPYDRNEKNHSAQVLYPNQHLLAQAPAFQSSCTDIFRPELLAGLSAASTTSRSTAATGTSSNAAYREYRRHKDNNNSSNRHANATGGELVEDEVDSYGRTRRHRRRHNKKSHRKHHHHGGRHHGHHHHHHRSHHQDDYTVSGRNRNNDSEHDDGGGGDGSEYGHHHGTGGGHSHHHHQHRHHHRHHHRDHRHKSSGGGGGGHYERSNSGQQSVADTNSNHNSLDNILRNDELASSHSSDDQDDASGGTLLKRNKIYSSAHQRATSGLATAAAGDADGGDMVSAAAAASKLDTGEQSNIGSLAAQIESPSEQQQQQQTVPMELLGSSSMGIDHDKSRLAGLTDE